MIKRILRSSVATIVLVAMGIALIGMGSVRGVRAALREQTRREYVAQMELNHVYTDLLEDGKSVEGSDALLTDLKQLAAQKKFAVGRAYPKHLAVKNASDVDEYVRVTVYRYWSDAQGNRVDLDPSLIDVHFVTGSGWTEDTAARTDERTVLYYTPVLAGNATTSDFVDTIAIKKDVMSLKEEDGSYTYQGLEFHLEAVVDAIQTHHHQDAMNGVWGTAYGVSE